MGSSKQDHFAVVSRQVEELRTSIQALEQDERVGRHTLRGGQTVDEHQAIHQAFDKLLEAVSHVSDVLLALAEAVNNAPKQ